jgi:hypothetical protein
MPTFDFFMQQRLKFLKRFYEGKTITFHYHHEETTFDGSLHICDISWHYQRIFFTVEHPDFQYNSFYYGRRQVNLFTDMFRLAVVGYFRCIDQYIPLQYYAVAFWDTTYVFNGRELHKIT